MEVEESPSLSSEGAFFIKHKYLNPLTIYEVLRIISQHLDFDSLRLGRLVRSQWNQVFIRQLISQSYLKIPASMTLPFDTSTLHKFNDNVKSLSLKFENIQISRLAHINVFQELRFYENIIDLKFILEDPLLPSLKTLELLNFFQNKFPSLTTLTIDSLDFASNFWHENNLNNLTLKLTSLQQIKVNNLQPDDLTQWPRIFGRLPIKELSPSLPLIQAYINSEIQWNLQKVSITINHDDPVDLIRNFLVSVSPTLKILQVYFNSDPHHEFEGIVRDPWQDNWYIPLCLENVGILEISEKCQQTTAHNSPVWRTLVTALQLPRLKKVGLKDAYSGNFNPILMEWNKRHGRLFGLGKIIEMEAARFGGSTSRAFKNPHKKLQSLSVQQLEINCHQHYFDPSFFTSRSFNLWPHLNKLVLHCTIAEPMPTILNSVFCRLQNQLQHLKLIIKSPYVGPSRFGVEDKDEFNWNSLLTGFDKTGGPVVQRREHCLKDFKSLKSLIIHCSENKLVSDFLIENVLMELKSLQFLKITGTLFSEEAVRSLRKALGPWPCLILNQDTLKILQLEQERRIPRGWVRLSD